MSQDKIKTKRCSRCKKKKNINQFHKDKWMKDGLCYMCKNCKKNTRKKAPKNSKQANYDKSHKNKNTCITCGKIICDISTYCRKCSWILLQTDEKHQRDQTIIDLFTKDKMLVKDIADLVNLSTVRINQILNKSNLHATHHKYSYDDSIWDNECAQKYYLMGLFAADGTISRNRNSKFIELTLNQKDRVLLEDIRNIFKTNKPLCLGKDNCLRFTLYSDKSYDYLTSWGIGERKSLSLHITKKIPTNYLLNFLHGVYDGDGSITKNTQKSASIVLACTASKCFADQMQAMYKQCGFDVACYECKQSNVRLNTLYMVKRDGQQGLHILAEIYTKADLFLPRKYIIFLEHTRLTPDETMMELAHTIKQRSTCIRWKVGCVITNDSRTNITAVGYNGQAKGEPNHCDSAFPGQCGCVHSENNALIKNNHRGTILYCTGLPCKQCAKLIVNAGIKQVFYDEPYRYCYALGLFNRSNISCRKINKTKYKWKLEINNKLNETSIK